MKFKQSKHSWAPILAPFSQSRRGGLAAKAQTTARTENHIFNPGSGSTALESLCILHRIAPIGAERWHRNNIPILCGFRFAGKVIKRRTGQFRSRRSAVGGRAIFKLTTLKFYPRTRLNPTGVLRCLRSYLQPSLGDS